MKNLIDLRQRLAKLAHPIEEIRIRAFLNLKSKLEHQVITVEDLKQERDLFLYLLEWFNYPNASLKSEILELLHKFSCIPESCDAVVGVGGIEFLSDLKKYVDDSEQQIINDILENLSKFPLPVHNAECRFYSPLHKGSSHVYDKTLPIHDSLLQPVTDLSISYMGRCGYFDKSQTVMAPHALNIVMPQDLQCKSFKFCIFPWLSLTQTDKHVLFSTIKSLEKFKEGTIMQTCYFLIDVVLHDFPPEIFLQRPQTIRCLLNLMTMTNEMHPTDTLHIVKFFNILTALLRKRIHNLSDPNFFTCNHDRVSVSSSQVTSPSTLSTSQSVNFIGPESHRFLGDGQSEIPQPAGNGNSSNPSEDELPNIKELQLTLPRYCSELAEHTTHVLKDCGAECVVVILEILENLLSLFDSCVKPSIWDNNSAPATEVTTSVLKAFGHFSESIALWHPSHLDKIVHHSAYLSIVSCFCKSLLKLLPATQMYTVSLPENVINTIREIFLDDGLHNSLPHIHEELNGYVLELDPGTCQLWDTCTMICSSLKATCQFLKQCCSDEKNERLYKQWISLAEEALFSFSVHQRIDVISKFISAYSIICQRPNVPLAIITDGAVVLLKCLAHHNVNIKKECYKRCCEIVQDALNVEKSVNSSLKSSSQVLFLVNPEIISEICMFGLCSGNEKVASCSRQIMLHLLQSQLLMPKRPWKRFMSVITNILPIIQAHTRRNCMLGKAIFHTTDLLSTQVDSLPHLEKLKGNLRFLYHVDEDIRLESAKTLVNYLLEIEGYQPTMSACKLESLRDTFMFFVNAEDTFEYYSSDLFVEERMENFTGLMEIINRKGSNELKLKSLKQICAYIKDPRLHSAFCESNGKEVILQFIRNATKNGSNMNEHDSSLLKYSVKILQYVLYYDPKFCKMLSDDERSLCDIFHAACLMMNASDGNPCAVSMFLLLFCEILCPVKITGDKIFHDFSIPHLLTKRFQVPIKFDIRNETSDHSPSTAADYQTSDIFKSSLAILRFKNVWNFAIFEDIDGIHQAYESDMRESSLIPTALSLSPAEIERLQRIDHNSAMQLTINSLKQATSHDEADKAVWAFYLRLMLMHEVHKYDSNENANFVIKERWIKAFDKFFYVIPSSGHDEMLLRAVLAVFSRILSAIHDQPFTGYLRKAFCCHSSPLYTKLHPFSDSNTRENKVVQKQILTLLIHVVNNCSNSKQEDLHLGELVSSLQESMTLTDESPFYNLANLEAVLSCLVHVTTMDNWSSSCVSPPPVTLCQNFISSLIQIILAFHTGRGKTVQSFMGTGIMKCASTVLQHVLVEVVRISADRAWLELFTPKNLHNSQSVDSNWLTLLLTYHDPEVRVAGLGIAIQLSRLPEGCQVVIQNLEKFAEGAWGASLNTLLDRSEFAIIREQAALLLSNLVANIQNVEDSSWNKDAFTTILHHSCFLKEILNMFENFYPLSYVQVSDMASLSNLTLSAHFSDHGNNELYQSAYSNHQEPQVRLGHLSFSPSLILESPLSKNQGTSTSNHSSPCLQSLVTRGLVATVSVLMRNLVLLDDSNFLAAIARDEMISLMLNCVEQCLKVDSATSETSISLYRKILDFCYICAINDDQCKNILAYCFCTLLKLLDLQILALQAILFDLMLVILPSAPQLLKQVLARWSTIFRSMYMSLSRMDKQPLSLKALQLFTLISNLETDEIIENKLLELTHLLDNSLFEIEPQKPEDSSLDICGKPISVILSTLLIDLYKVESLKKLSPDFSHIQDKYIIASALSLLLCRSHLAKSMAIKENLAKVVFDSLKALHSNLNVEVTQSFRKKEVPCVVDMIMCVNLLNNMAHDSTDAKNILYNNKLSRLLTMMCNWCFVHENLMSSCLNFIVTYTSSFDKGCCSLVDPHILPSGKIKSPSTMFQCLTNVLEKELQRLGMKNDSLHLERLCLIFIHLSQCVETRSCVIKSPLLEIFLQVLDSKSRKNKFKVSAARQVIDVLLVLSKYPEGQAAIIQSSESISILADCININDNALSMKSQLIIRNIAFHPSSRPKLLSNKTLRSTLIENLGSKHRTVVCLSISTIWSLIANNQKAKQALKKENINAKLENSLYIHHSEADLREKIEVVRSVIGKEC